MSTKNELSRITIDISSVLHKKLKALAAVQGRSMREVIVELIDENLFKPEKKKTKGCSLDHTPNKKTLKSIKNIEEGKNLTKYASVKDLFKKMGL